MELLKKQLGDKSELVDRIGLLRRQPELNTLIANDKLTADAAATLLKRGGFGIAKESVLPVQASMVNPNSLHKRVERKLKRYLNSEYTAAIVGAFALIGLEDRQKTSEDLVEIKATRDKYFKRDEFFRRRIYNDCRSGYVEDILYIMALDLEAEGKSREAIRDVLMKTFTDSISTNALNIYVNSIMSNDEVTSRMRAKLMDEGRTLIRVYARGENWDRTIGLTMRFAEANDLGWHREERPIGRTPSGCCRIYKKGLGKWPEIERAAEDALRQEFKEKAE